MKGRYSLESVARAARVLDALVAGPAQLAGVARDTGLSQATALRYLSSLEEQGLADRDQEGRWRLGLRLFQLGQRALGSRDPRAAVLPVMHELLERFHETVNFAVPIGRDLVIVETLESSLSIRHGSRVGERDLWHSSAVGKAILAGLAREEARAVLAHHGSPRRTPHTLTTLPELEGDLAAVRARGYALDLEESDVGASCVGAAVCGPDGRPLGAISVSGPTSRVSDGALPAIGAAVAQAAGAASAALGYAGGA
jgi:IclR family acetate operon transcriptional repressor